MRDCIRDFVRRTVHIIPVSDPIYEFGSLRVPWQEQLADLRPLIPGHTYVGCDVRPGPGVDQILDLHKIDLPDESVGTVLCLDTLEHVEFCRRAVREMYRILAPNGFLLLSSVLDFPIHEHPCDYWRFTPQGFRSLLSGFETAYVWSLGPEKFPHTVVGLGHKGTLSASIDAEIQSQVELWRQANIAPIWKRTIREILPPFALSLINQLVKPELKE